MAKKFESLNFARIEEGRAADSLDEAIAKASRELVLHVARYGPARTSKSKAEVHLKITLARDGSDGDDYSIKTAIAIKTPGRPAFVTRAIRDCEQTGEETLFVRSSGSTEETPRQGRLATDDGRGIDEDGNVIEPAKKAKGEK